MRLTEKDFCPPKGGIDVAKDDAKVLRSNVCYNMVLFAVLGSD